MGTLIAGCEERTPERERALSTEMWTKQVFKGVPETDLARLVSMGNEVCSEAGTVLAEEDKQANELMILLEGRVRISRRDAHGKEIYWKKLSAPDFMGEVAILANQPNPVRVVADTDTRGFRLGAEAFWQLMSECPKLRGSILTEVRWRTRGLQAFAAQQEKLATLGTLTAGLMHELNNPGSAARRAASQLRANLNRMHMLAQTVAGREHTEAQLRCLNTLQERILASHGSMCLSSLEQADAEEEMGAWMDGLHVTNAWAIAPVLVNSGITPGDLLCLQELLGGADLNEPLHLLEATASSVQTIDIVEESVKRVSELAHAVKSYVHEGQGGTQNVDVNESIHATLVMLKHKLREKNIHLEKQFGAALPQLQCVCSGLNQVWTNLLDNAIDAVGPDGHIRVRTWKDEDFILIGFHDDGTGILPENQERIFDPFFTTKPAGVGTGLGLGIVQRTLEGYNAFITLESKPGATEFVVHIPVSQSS